MAYHTIHESSAKGPSLTASSKTTKGNNCHQFFAANAYLATSPDNNPTKRPLTPWSPMTYTHFLLSWRSLSLPNKKQGAKWCVPRRYFAKQTIKTRHG
jgi:hypothetical protein